MRCIPSTQATPTTAPECQGSLAHSHGCLPMTTISTCGFKAFPEHTPIPFFTLAAFLHNISAQDKVHHINSPKLCTPLKSPTLKQLNADVRSIPGNAHLQHLHHLKLQPPEPPRVSRPQLPQKTLLRPPRRRKDLLQLLLPPHLFAHHFHPRWLPLSHAQIRIRHLLHQPFVPLPPSISPPSNHPRYDLWPPVLPRNRLLQHKHIPLVLSPPPMHQAILHPRHLRSPLQPMQTPPRMRRATMHRPARFRVA